MASILLFGAIQAQASEWTGGIVGISDDAQVATEYYSEDLLLPLDEPEEIVALNPDGKLDIAAKSVVLMEVSTGQILYENNSHEKLPPASITKIMSLLLIFEAIDQGKLGLDNVITASEHACSLGGSQIWLEPGETMTVDELLKASVIASANDATVALAETVAGSEEAFVALMNQKAQQLGLKDTHFVNCHGLDVEGHYTSAHDVAVMSCELIKHDLVKKYSTVWMDSLRGGKTSLVNTNKLVRFYDGCTGLKTGTTSQAGSCVAATAMRDGMEIVAVVMGAASSKDRFNGARKLLDYGFANWSKVDVKVDESLLKNVPVKGGLKKDVAIRAEGNSSILVAKGRQNDVVQNITLAEMVEAPVEQGQQLGQVHLMLDDEEVGIIPILAVESVGKMTFKAAYIRLLAVLFRL